MLPRIRKEKAPLSEYQDGRPVELLEVDYADHELDTITDLSTEMTHISTPSHLRYHPLLASRESSGLGEQGAEQVAQAPVSQHSDSPSRAGPTSRTPTFADMFSYQVGELRYYLQEHMQPPEGTGANNQSIKESLGKEYDHSKEVKIVMHLAFLQVFMQSVFYLLHISGVPGRRSTMNALGALRVFALNIAVSQQVMSLGALLTLRARGISRVRRCFYLFSIFTIYTMPIIITVKEVTIIREIWFSFLSSGLMLIVVFLILYSGRYYSI